MINLAWGNYQNGSVPDSATAPIDGAGHRLEKTAAANWLAMAREGFAATGKWISVAPGAGSAGRTFSQQQEFWRIYQAGGNTAAYPGTSNHGWWRAVDITGYETATSRWVGSTYVNDGPVWKWLMANIARFGFSWDTGRASRESWHFESIATPGSTATASTTVSALPQLKRKKPTMFLLHCPMWGDWIVVPGVSARKVGNENVTNTLVSAGNLERIEVDNSNWNAFWVEIAGFDVDFAAKEGTTFVNPAVK